MVPSSVFTGRALLLFGVRLRLGGLRHCILLHRGAQGVFGGQCSVSCCKRGKRSPVPARRCRPSWGRRSCFRGCRLCSSLLCGCSRSRRCSGLFFHALAGRQTAARQTQQCSPPQRMQSRFSGSPYYFSSFPFGAVGRIGLALPQQSRRLHRQARRLGCQQEVVPAPPMVMAAAITRHATAWPMLRPVPFLLDFLKDVGFMPLALPPSWTGQDTRTAPAPPI